MKHLVSCIPRFGAYYFDKSQDYDGNRYQPAITTGDEEAGGFGAQLGFGGQLQVNPLLLTASVIVGYPVNRVNDAEVAIAFPPFAILQAGAEFRF